MDYKKYFQQLISIAKEYGLELNHSLDKHHYINVKTIDGYKFNLVISSKKSKAYGEKFTGFIVEIYMDGTNFREKFNNLYLQRLKIDSEIENLIWQDSSPTDKVCRIFSRKEVSIENENEWEKSINWQINTLLKFLEVFPKYIDKFKRIGDFDKMKKVRVGAFVQEHLEKIVDYCKLNKTEINYLQQNLFGLSYPFLIQNENVPTGRSRYWQKTYKIENINYRFCSEFGGSKIDSQGKTLSQRHGESFLEYLKSKDLLLDKYKHKQIEFIVGNTEIDNPSKEIYNKNIILYGAPGVGKTHNYKKLISLIEKGELSEKEIFKEIENSTEKYDLENFDDDLKSRVEFITFHQSFEYEDFIEGFRPNENGDIVLKDGIFKTICEEAKENYEKNFYLVIDEINRGNISKIFGELITLIEESKRDDYQVTLPYSKEKFSVPSNLYIIGTMNTTDKSIALIDVALRRRFTFIKMQPIPKLVIKSFQDTFIKLNEQIKTDLGEEYQIGHSYFMNIDDADLDFVKEYKIKPLLEEYYYGNDKLNEVLKIIGIEEDSNK